MPEWLNAAVPGPADLPAAQIFGRLVQAAALGFAVAAVYYLTQRKRRAEAAPFVATLVLLTVLIAMVTRVIGDNVARAFSLAGALAIIRFRTVVDDTRDTAFVIAAVVTGMAVGADYVGVALAGLPVVAVVAVLLSAWGHGTGPPAGRGNLTVRLGTGLDPAPVLGGILAKYTESAQVTSAATARQGAALDVTYAVRLRPGVSAVALVGELHRTEGVQGVEWKEAGGG